VTWTAGATVSSTFQGVYSEIVLSGVSARYIRLRRAENGQLALGDFRFYATADAGANVFGVPLLAVQTPMNTAVAAAPLSHFPQLTMTTIATNPAHGTAVLNTGAQTIVYTRAPAMSAPTASSMGWWTPTAHPANGSVNVTVTATATSGAPASGNHAPVAVNDSITTHGAALTFNPRINDSDPDGDALTISAAAGIPGHGTAQVNGGASITYTPDAGYVGSDSFTYQIADVHGATATATVFVTAASNPLFPLFAFPTNITTQPGVPITFRPAGPRAGSQ